MTPEPARLTRLPDRHTNPDSALRNRGELHRKLDDLAREQRGREFAEKVERAIDKRQGEA